MLTHPPVLFRQLKVTQDTFQNAVAIELGSGGSGVYILGASGVAIIAAGGGARTYIATVNHSWQVVNYTLS